MNILIIGKPGSGKGTITQKLIEDCGDFIQLSTGDLLRVEQEKKTEVGAEITKLLLAGKFATDDIIFNLVDKFLKKNKDKSIIFDGFPRNLVQAKACVERNLVFDHIFVLTATDEMVMQRINGRFIHRASGRVYNTDTMPPKVAGIDDLTGDSLIKRYDDNPDIMKIRLSDYKELTSPIIDYFNSVGYNITTIDSGIDLKDQLNYIKNNILGLNKTNKHGI